MAGTSHPTVNRFTAKKCSKIDALIEVIRMGNTESFGQSIHSWNPPMWMQIKNCIAVESCLKGSIEESCSTWMFWSNWTFWLLSGDKISAQFIMHQRIFYRINYYPVSRGAVCYCTKEVWQYYVFEMEAHSLLWVTVQSCMDASKDALRATADLRWPGGGLIGAVAVIARVGTLGRWVCKTTVNLQLETLTQSFWLPVDQLIWISDSSGKEFNDDIDLEP